MRKAFILCLCCIFFAAKLSYINKENSKAPSLKVLDVGQGDAILFLLPGNKKVLIDGGPDYEIDRYLSRHFLFNECRLDLVILTHPHADHLAGLNRIKSRCDINNIVEYPIVYDSVGYADWSAYTTAVAKPTASTFNFNGILLVLLVPDTAYKNVNNNSVGLFLKHNSFEALFLGDMEEERLRDLDFTFLMDAIEGHLDVLKVPHHGGRTSIYSGLANLNPRVCVISVGEMNRYGHPHDEVLTFYKSIGCRIKRTDLSGTIEVLAK